MRVEDRRGQLLAIGLEAFSARPYDDVSTEDVAVEAGISHGLLFHYFPTKRAFYLAVLRMAAGHLIRAAVAGGEGAPHERLVAGLGAYFRFVEKNGRAYATLLLAGSDREVKAIVDETRGRFLGLIAEVLGPGRSAPERRRLRAALRGWIGLVEALALDWIDHRDLPVEDRIAIAVRGMAVAVPGADAALRPQLNAE